MKKKVASFATVLILSTSISTHALASTYIVQKGDTLESIAGKHKITVKEIKTLNQLKSNALFVNQKLQLNQQTSSNVQKTPAKPGSSKPTYTVIKGDSLIKIANKHGITLAELKLWNSLTKDNLYVGQSLIVSKSAEPPKEVNVIPVVPPLQTNQPASQGEYVVKSGDNLSKIAAQYKMTVEQLKTINQLNSDMIFVGQKLHINVLSDVDQKPINEQNSSTESILIKEALNLLNTPYLFGGSSVEAFDCSGFIYYVFNKAGISINRLSSEGYYNRAYYVDVPQPGDMIFFSDTYKPGISHMGIYMGDQQFIHASPTNGVEIANVNDAYYKKHFEGYKRFY